MGLFFEEIEVPPLVGPYPLVGDTDLCALEAGLPAGESRLSPRVINEDQFTLFQLDESGIIDLHNVEPSQEGSDNQPDIRVGIELVSLNIGPAVRVDENTRVTLRIDVGEQFSANSFSDALFWAIAAGIDLYKKRELKAAAPELRANLVKNFRRQPVDLAGSLGIIRIAVVTHREPPWWRKVFRFGTDEVLGDLFSMVGFPAITGQALKLVDSFFDLLESADPRVLIHSQPISVAFSLKARNDFCLGLNAIKIAVLNPGWFVMVRYADVAAIAEHNPVYLGGYGVLVPKQVARGNNHLAKNPLNEFTYAVLRVRSTCTCLNPAL